MLSAEELAFMEDKLMEREMMTDVASEDTKDTKYAEVEFDEATLAEIDSGKR